LHWRVLSEIILSPGEHQALLTGIEIYRAMSGKAEGVFSSTQAGSFQVAEERGDAAPKKSPEVIAEPSYAFLDRSSAKELVNGPLAQPTTPEASSLQSPALGDQASSDLTLDPKNETGKEGGRVSREPENRPNRAWSAREEVSDTATPPAASLTPGTANEYQVRPKREPRAARMIRGRHLDTSSPEESGERVAGSHPARDYRDLRNQMLNQYTSVSPRPERRP
jgi:hypothetical protein